MKMWFKLWQKQRRNNRKIKTTELACKPITTVGTRKRNAEQSQNFAHKKYVIWIKSVLEYAQVCFF